jgi:Cft2 family RNA processing exonuclease
MLDFACAQRLDGRVFGTPETLEIYRARVLQAAENGTEYVEMRFGEPVEYHGARLTAFPASHILGAA